MLIRLYVFSSTDRYCLKFGHVALAVVEVDLNVLTGKGIDGLEGLMEDAKFLNVDSFTLRSSWGGLA